MLAYSYDGASTSRSGVTGLLQDVFTRETPMAPAEVTHLVKAEEIQRYLRYTSSAKPLRLRLIKWGDITSRLRVRQGKVFDANNTRRNFNPLEKLAMVARPVLTKVFENLGQWRFWHGNLKEIVAEWNLCPKSVNYNRIGGRVYTHHAIICPRLAAEGEWSLRNAFIDDAIGKHGLRGDSEDEPEVFVLLSVTI